MTEWSTSNGEDEEPGPHEPESAGGIVLLIVLLAVGWWIFSALARAPSGYQYVALGVVGIVLLGRWLDRRERKG